MEKALHGVRVLEPAQYLSGPVAGMLLGDMGAEVIHIERTKVGDPLRGYGFQAGDQSSRFLWANRNKKSITLDLTTQKGNQIFKELARNADVIIENFPPGTMAEFGLGYEELEKVCPQVVYASISGFGQYGPYKDRLAFDLIAQAAGGLMNLTGYPEQPPVRAGTPMADILSGLMTLFGILAALFSREKTKRGQYVDVSLMDVTFFCLGCQFIEQVNFGLMSEREGNSYPGAGVTGIYESKDGYFVIQAPRDKMWQGLVQAIGREDLVDDPRFDTNLKRVQHADLVNEAIRQWSRNKSVQEVTEILTRAEVPFFPVMTIDQLSVDRSLLERDMILESEHPSLGKVKIPGVPLKLSATPGKVDRTAPSLGEHNQEIYGNLLGFTAEEIKRLEEEGII